MPDRSASDYSEATVVASRTETTAGNVTFSPATGWGPANTLVVQLAVTAISGTTPSLAVFIEDTVDGTNWSQVGSFTAKTATGAESVRITTPFADRLRLRWTLTGTTPSATFNVIAAAQGQLA